MLQSFAGRLIFEQIAWFIPAASVFVTTVSGIVSLIFAMIALRAKTRAWVALQNTADDALRIQVQRLEIAEHFTRPEIEQLRTMVESRAIDLSEEDKRVLELGLTQPSEAGASRFARELLTGKV